MFLCHFLFLFCVMLILLYSVHYIFILLLLEIILLSVYLLLSYFCISFFGMAPLFFFLILMVCMGAFSISVLVFTSRFSGRDFWFSTYIF